MLPGGYHKGVCYVGAIIGIIFPYSLLTIASLIVQAILYLLDPGGNT